MERAVASLYAFIGVVESFNVDFALRSIVLVNLFSLGMNRYKAKG